MDNKSVGIIGIGAYLPKKIVTNNDLEKMVNTSDEWITTRTGIKKRRLAAPEMAASDLGIYAAKNALKNANIKPAQLGAIIVATMTPDMLSPATACIIQEKLKADQAACFDINAACTGFIYGLAVARSFIISGEYKYVLVVACEKISSFIDWQDRSTCVLFGDGAGAVVLGPKNKNRIISVYLGSDGNKAELLKIPAGGSRCPATLETVKNRLHFLKMNGNEIFKFAVKNMTSAAEKARKLAGVKKEDIDCVIPHQANIRIINATAKRLGIPREKIFFNIEKYGNMSAASVVVGLYEAIKTKRIKKGNNVILVAFGSGLTWGACVIKC
ncbi:MAG: beta-ketoacyl-ACP synthase III [Candidatus Omnitrophota bacterium]